MLDLEKVGPLGCWTSRRLDLWDVGPRESWTSGMLDLVDVGPRGCWTSWMLDLESSRQNTVGTVLSTPSSKTS